MSGYNFSASGGVGPGFNWWEQIGGGNTNIELNAGAGATGIQAVLPSDSRYSLDIATVAALGTIFAGTTFIDPAATLIAIAGIIQQAGIGLPSMAFRNTGTNTSAIVQLSDNDVFISAKASPTVFISIDVTSNDITVRNFTTAIFKIFADGRLFTNQVSAGRPVSLLPTKKLKIVDSAGTLVGYAPIYPT